jgi:hypothetical protein
MSIRIMSLVWERAPHREGALLTLLALADWANDEGECWPSIPKLAVKARQSERNLRYILRDLEVEGLLVVTAGGGRYHTNHYHLNLARLQTLQPLPGLEKSAAPMLGKENETLQPLPGSEETLQSATANPAIGDSKPCKLQPASSDPSGDPLGEPNLARAPDNAPAPEEGGTVTAAPETAEGWHTCPPDFFVVIKEVLAHPPGRCRDRDPPATAAEGGPAP